MLDILFYFFCISDMFGTKKPTNEDKQEVTAPKDKDETESIDRRMENLSRLSAIVPNMNLNGDNGSSDDELPEDPILGLLNHKTKYTVLVIGSGARENAIVNALVKSKFNIVIKSVGNYRNPGIAKYAESVIVTSNIDKITRYIQKVQPDLMIVGPVEYIDSGITDWAKELEIPCFGPTSQFVKIINRAYAKDLLANHKLGDFNVKYHNFTYFDEVIMTEFIESLNNGYLIKGSNYCNGSTIKTSITDFKSVEEALNYCNELIENEQHRGCIIEELVEGNTFTTTSFVDGVSVYHMPIVQSFKRFEADGVSYVTSNMGSISMEDHKLDFLTENDVRVANNINNVVVCALQQDTEDKYTGIICCNLIKSITGEIKVSEFNCTFSDPSAINILSVMDSDFMEVCIRTVESSLKQFDIACRHEATCVSYGVPIGYPNTSYKDREIIVDDHTMGDILYGNVHSYDDNDKKVLLGLKAVAVVGRARNLVEARSKATSLHKMIHGPIEWRLDTTQNLVSSTNQKMTYESAGVNVDTNTQVVETIKRFVESTHDDSVISQYGDFSALMKVNKNYLSFSMDGLGSKPKVALEYIRPISAAYQSLGQDLVNLCVNDILPQGTLPLAFLDSISAAKISTANVRYFIEGMAMACVACNCRLVGGETCEMPNVYLPESCEMMGCVVGYEDSSKGLIDRSKMKAGDDVYAWKSTGPHTNGFTLIKKILDESQLKYDMNEQEFKNFISWLCNVHKSYYDELEAYKGAKVHIKGMAHITGGGLIENPKRIVPDNLQMILDKNRILENMPNNFQLLANYAGLTEFELFKTFNCGIGMLVVVSQKDTELINRINNIKGWNNNIYKVGYMVERKEKEDSVKFIQK